MTQYSYSLARKQMIDNHIKTWGVTDPNILHAFSKIPRERFVDEAYLEMAYSDANIPIGFNQIGLAPKLIARGIQSLNLSAASSVLEIGTGTGYATAILAQCARIVISVEILPSLVHIATRNMAEHHLSNTEIIQADGASALQLGKQFDAIFISGAFYMLPTFFQSLLKPGGKMFAIVGEKPAMQGVCIEKNQHQHVQHALFECMAPYLDKIVLPNTFIF